MLATGKHSGAKSRNTGKGFGENWLISTFYGLSIHIGL